MDDLIRRSDAIAEIYKVRTPDVVSYHYAELFINAVCRAPSADRPQEWVPCSERLPDYMTAVLTWDGMAYAVEKRIPYITDDDGEHIMSEWWVSDDFDEENTEYYPNLRDGAAIAWMPLPEPWKGVDDEVSCR